MQTNQTTFFEAPQVEKRTNGTVIAMLAMASNLRKKAS